MVQKILLFKIGAIGDVLMTTPLVRQLRKNFPEAKIDYLIGKSSSKILEGNKNIDEIIPFKETIFTEKKLKEWKTLIEKVKARKYDLIFVLDKHWAFTLTSSLFKILKRVGFNRLGKEGKTLTHKVYYRNSKHEIYHYLDLLSIIKKKTDYSDTKLDITLTRKDTLGASKLLDKTKNYYVLINSGGNNVGEQSNIRKMPRKLFKELVEKISKKNKIIFLGTDSERTYYEKFILNKKCFNLAGQTSLKESVSILKKAKRVITTDSGPMHMASAVNNKIISVFGSTNPKRKAPLNKGAKAIWKDKKIYEEKYEIFGKKPKNKQFMKTITSEEVLNLL